MVNENQIVPDRRYLTHEATRLFIEDDQLKSPPPELYNLDQEFAKTKKNKNSALWLSLPLFVILSLGAAYFVTKYIEEGTSKVPISINAFEDVNLREIFDKAKQHEKEMEKARRELDDLYLQRGSEREELESKAKRDIEVIRIDGNRIASRIGIVETTLERDLAANEEKWDILINEAKAKIKEIQNKIDSYDTRIMEKAKEQEDLINNQQKRFDIEMEETVTYYENKIENLVDSHLNELKTLDYDHKRVIDSIRLSNKRTIEALEVKYNPVFNETFNFLNSEIEKPEMSSGIFSSIDSILYSEGLIDIEGVMGFRKDLLQGLYTFNELKKIPYYNSPSSSIEYLESLYIENINNYVNLLKKLIPKIKDKNTTITKQFSEIGKLNYFLTDYIKSNRINGLIIDPRGDEIRLFIDPIYRVPPGSTAYVFRNDSDYIGTIIIDRDEDGNFTGKIKELVKQDRGFGPFDMILLEIE